MYNKGDLKKLVADLRKQGVDVERFGATYRINAKIKEFGGLILRQKTDKFGCCRVLTMVGYWDDGCPRWSSINWDDVKKKVQEVILAE